MDWTQRLFLTQTQDSGDKDNGLKLVQSNYLNNSQIHSQIFHLNHFYFNNFPEPFSATPFSGSPSMDLPMWDLPPIFGFLISTFLFLWSPSSSWLGVTFSHLWILNLIFSFSTGDSGGCRQSTGLETQASPWTGRRFGSQVTFQPFPRFHVGIDTKWTLSTTEMVGFEDLATHI